ncbi:MAG: SusD/RagB family nutrient-binding outer membrane lipoprotein [Gemmatimonadota bacterium]|nr:SusD/RagB family nutrient-binding outer membrane lipoprotein [Gemmatimonadota bacterium]
MTRKSFPSTSVLRAASAALIVVAASACSHDLTGLNNNPNSPTNAPPGPLFTNAVQSLVGRFRGANFDFTGTSLFAQHLAKVQYVDEDQYNLRTTTTASHFASPYTGGLEDLQKIIKGATATQANTSGPASVMKDWSFQIMTDTWGDIPYSQALKGDSVGGSLTPAYDPQKDIYAGMMADLTKVATSMTDAATSTDPGLGGSDPIYSGNPAKWRKFANSLHARMALRLYKVDPATANTQLQAALSAPGGIMMSNADNAQLVWPGDGVYDNPWAANFATRDDDRMSKTLVDTLNALHDKRLTVYAQPTQADPTKYAGMPNGLSTSAAGSYFNTASRPGAIFYPGVTVYGTFGTAAGKKTPSYLMVYSELAFIQAEAAERGIGGLSAGQAAGFYNAGVRASFDQWGLSVADANAYLATPGVAYAPGANGLNQIGLQKWIALYTQGSEAWAGYRRTGNPASLTPGPAAILTQIPRRIPYSVDEQSVNAISRAAAVARQGPDNFLTRVYWDKP